MRDVDMQRERKERRGAAVNACKCGNWLTAWAVVLWALVYLSVGRCCRVAVNRKLLSEFVPDGVSTTKSRPRVTNLTQRHNASGSKRTALARTRPGTSRGESESEKYTETTSDNSHMAHMCHQRWQQ